MEEKNTLCILWSNPDVHTGLYIVMMYAKNSLLRGWWEHVTVIIWGGTAKLAAGNAAIQEEMKVAQNVGVKFSACVACARQLGVVSQLEALGIEAIPWGTPLTEILKNNEKLLTV